MTPSAFLRKFAGREITAGDVVTHCGVHEYEAMRQLAAWSRQSLAWRVMDGPSGLWRITKTPPKGVTISKR